MDAKVAVVCRTTPVKSAAGNVKTAKTEVNRAQDEQGRCCVILVKRGDIEGEEQQLAVFNKLRSLGEHVLHGSFDTKVNHVYFAPSLAKTAMEKLDAGDLTSLFANAQAKDAMLPPRFKEQNFPVIAISLAALGSSAAATASAAGFSQASAAASQGEDNFEDFEFDASAPPQETLAPAASRTTKRNDSREDFKREAEMLKHVEKALENDGLVCDGAHDGRQTKQRIVDLLMKTQSKRLETKFMEAVEAGNFTFEGVIDWSNSATKLFFEWGLGGGAALQPPRKQGSAPPVGGGSGEHHTVQAARIAAEAQKEIALASRAPLGAALGAAFKEEAAGYAAMAAAMAPGDTKDSLEKLMLSRAQAAAAAAAAATAQALGPVGAAAGAASGDDAASSGGGAGAASGD